MTIDDVILEGNYVRMVPMAAEHKAALAEAGIADGLWDLTVNRISTPEEMAGYVDTALDERRRGVSLPFVTVDKSSDKIVGSTRFGNIDTANRKAEIGWTWVNPEWQRTYVNTEAKFLMLRHAFETWRCIRIEFKTDALNEVSRAAILRVGAKFEGIFRNHMITDSGRFRNSAYFSIIEDEWPTVKKGLISKLNRNIR